MTVLDEVRPDTIDGVLREFGMWSSSRSKRRAKAEQLEADGASAEDIWAVCEFIEEQARHEDANAREVNADAPETWLAKTGSRLNSILLPEVWRDALRSAQAAADRGFRPATGPRPEPGASERAENDAHREPAAPPPADRIDLATTALPPKQRVRAKTAYRRLRDNAARLDLVLPEDEREVIAWCIETARNHQVASLDRTLFDKAARAMGTPAKALKT